MPPDRDAVRRNAVALALRGADGPMTTDDVVRRVHFIGYSDSLPSVGYREAVEADLLLAVERGRAVRVDGDPPAWESYGDGSGTSA